MGLSLVWDEYWVDPGAVVLVWLLVAGVARGRVRRKGSARGGLEVGDPERDSAGTSSQGGGVWSP